MAPVSRTSLETFARIAQALADKNRLRLLLALQGRELCVCQMVELLGLAPSTVSKHLSILRAAGLVRSRKDERWMFYRPVESDAPAAAFEAIGWAVRALMRDARIAEDDRKLGKILKVERSHLCRKQTSRGGR